MSDDQASVGLAEMSDTLSANFLIYAEYVIKDRAIPDVRDGLKPGQRRILWSIWDMGCKPKTPHRKSARIVGDVIGKYHPHGDSAVYEAMARMAQPFVMAHPLVDGKGNFGSVDGHPAAAMRYTEARLTEFGAHVLFSDIDLNTVDFTPNYDGSEKEPVVLPARVPLLLLAAPSGIAVAMATNTPPHNLREVCKAVISTVENGSALTPEQVSRLVIGPDFPLGGMVRCTKYTGAKESVPFRSIADFESEGSSKAIIIRSIPYLANKAELIKSVAELVRDDKLGGISEIRDESSGNEIRICVELKRDSDHQSVLSALYQNTRLQTTFPVNIMAISGRKPHLFDVSSVLNEFVRFRKEVITRRTAAQKAKAEHRLKMTSAVIAACTNPDKTVKLIRGSDEPVAALMDAYKFDQECGEYVFNMPVRRFSKVDVNKLDEEQKSLSATVVDSEDILSRPERLNSIIVDETKEVDEMFGSDRRTMVVADFSSISVKDLVKQQDVVLSFMSDKTVKATPLADYRVQKRRGVGVSGTKIPDGVYPSFAVTVSSHDEVMLITDKGNRYRVRVYDIPAMHKGRLPKKLSDYVAGFSVDETVVSVAPLNIEDGECLVILGANGLMKKLAADSVRRAQSKTTIIYDVERGGPVVGAVVCKVDDDIMMSTERGQILRTSLSDIREVKGRAAAGVMAMKVEEGDSLLGVTRVIPGGQVLTVSAKGYAKRCPVDDFNGKGRGGKGVGGAALVEGDRLLYAGVVSVSEDSTLFLLTNTTQCIRIAMADVPVHGRVTRGVRLKRLDEKEEVTVASPE